MIAAGWPRNPPMPSAFVNNQTQVIANPIELGQGAETVLTQFKDDRPLMNTPEALSKLNSASHSIYQNDNRKFNRSTSQLPLPIRTQNMVKDYLVHVSRVCPIFRQSDFLKFLGSDEIH